jgi:uncharacterized protein involved in exopolysaccharide biosynthesis
MSMQFPPQSSFEPPTPQLDPSDPMALDGGSAAGYGYGAGYGASSSGASGPAESDLNIVHYLQILYRRRFIAISAFLLVFLGVALYTATATRIYQATTRILIERDTPNVVSFQEVLDQSNLTDDYYETQYAILRGRGLARRTIDSLDLWSHPDGALQHDGALVRTARTG